MHVEDDIMSFFVRCRINFKMKILNSKGKQTMGTKDIKKMKNSAVIFNRKVAIKN